MIITVPLSDGSMLLYVDDSMLYRTIHTLDDYGQLQLDINKLCTWTNNNLLQYNFIKCKCNYGHLQKEAASSA